MPDGLLEILQIPGVGPRTVKLLHEELGIDSVDALRAAAADGQLRGIKGLSERTEQNILAGIARLEQKVTRVLLHEADEMIGGLIARLRDVSGVVRIEPAGSLRRRKATIGDLDLLAATDNPQELIAVLDGLTEVDRILSAGTDKSSIVLGAGLQVDLMVCPPAGVGHAPRPLHRQQGAQRRAARLALDRGLRLSEKGFKVVEIGELLLATPRRRSTRASTCRGSRPSCARDDGRGRGRRAGARCRDLSPLADLQGDTHVHSDWTDGVDSIEVMARASRDRGREWMVLTDHSPSLGVARGLTLERIVEQKAEIDRLNAELAPFRILHGTEMEIRADGSLDYPDELLAVFDLVVASVHTSRRSRPSS